MYFFGVGFGDLGVNESGCGFNSLIYIYYLVFCQEDV
jgi:hypothetical protein